MSPSPERQPPGGFGLHFISFDEMILNNSFIDGSGVGNMYFGLAGDLNATTTFVQNFGGGIVMESLSGNLNLNNVTLDASGFIDVFAADTLSLSNSSLMPGDNFIYMQARTVDLQNINFPAGSIVDLRSQFGMLAPNPSTSQPSLAGHVNFIQNVLYNGAPAQNEVPISQGGSGPGNAIQISTP